MAGGRAPGRPGRAGARDGELAEVEHDREYKRPWGDVAMLDAFLRDVVDGR
ncbi:hypothetical protein [Burkholderia metallica]|uniref:hypothetical protein n=1 Tax=Burkholderia metallica TaxID=488729 RepID=UPI001F5BD16F|nr:hypothetical protein [Burkholderia metallica]